MNSRRSCTQQQSEEWALSGQFPLCSIPASRADPDRHFLPKPVICYVERRCVAASPKSPLITRLDLSRFRSALVAHLGGFRSKANGLFQPNAECFRRGL